MFLSATDFGRNTIKHRSFYSSLKTLVVTLALGLGIFGSAAAQQTALKPFEMNYDIYRGGSRIAQAHYVFKNENGQYHYVAKAKPKGFLAKLLLGDRVAEEESLGWFTPEGVPQPRRYYHHPGKDSRVEQAQFSWRAAPASASLTYKGNTKNLPLKGIVVDKLSLQLMVMQALKAGEKNALRYRVAERGNINEYRLNVMGMERIKVPMGEYDAVRIERNTSSRRSSFWLAPSLGYVIIQGEQQKKNDPIVRMQATGMQGRP